MMGKNTHPETRKPPRRHFLKTVWVSFVIVALVELTLMILSFFRPAAKKGSMTFASRVVDAGSIESYLPGTVSAFVQGRFYLVCLSDGGFLAVSSKCTHLGCAVPWNPEQKKFICPCHASEFDIFGNVISSPAPRALDLFKVTVINKNIQVDISTRIKRTRFNKDQVVYAQTVNLIQAKRVKK